MKFRVIILSLILVLFAPVLVWALEEESIKKYNEVIDQVYRQIWTLKERYPELDNFSKSAIKTHPDGFKEISFSHKPSEDDGQGDPYALQFSLKARKLDEVTDGTAEWKFGLLGFKVVMERRRSGSLTTFDPFEIIEGHVEELYLLEQNVLPFRLELSADKEIYAPKEVINLTVTLRNLGAQPFRVFELNDKSLFCRIDDMTWGSQVPKDTSEKVLAPYSILTKILRVRGIAEAKEARISCRYGVGFRGVQPFNRVKVRIQPAS
jgi:hypothetical protein